MKKILAIVLTLALTVCLFGCTGSTTSSTTGTTSKMDTSSTASVEKKDPITLKWFNVGTDNQKDYEIAMENINKTVQSYAGLEHVSLDITTAGWGDCNQKLTLMIGSDEAPDLFNPCAAGYLYPWVKQGACADLTELVKQYAPDVLTELPEWLLATQTVDGKLYAVPTYQQNNMNYYCYFMPTELASKYMDTAALEKLADAQATNEEEGVALQKSRADLISAYLEKCKAAGEIRKGAMTTNLINTAWSSVGFSVGKFESIHYADYDPTFGNNGKPTIVLHHNGLITLDEIKTAAQTGTENAWQELATGYLYDWWTKGYIREDVLSTKDSDLQGKADGLVIWTEQSVGANDPTIRKTNEAAASKKYKFDVTIIPKCNTYLMNNTNASGGHCVYVNCKYKEEAVRVAGLMATKNGADLLNAVVWGVEGTHYSKLDNGTIVTPYAGGMAGADDAYGQYNWAWGNIFNGYTNQATDPTFFSFVQKMHQAAVPNKLAGFTADSTAYDSELALLKALAKETVIYDKTNGYGSDTYRAAVKKYYQSLLDNGIEKVLTGFQSQIDAFLAKK